jgi:hypothetical protein
VKNGYFIPTRKKKDTKFSVNFCECYFLHCQLLIIGMTNVLSL